jgi:4-amino-4-deoxy-L-arabinose transferase-like glycosyltransferase
MGYYFNRLRTRLAKAASVPRDWPAVLVPTILAATIACVVIVRLQALSVPLERDEGEYALMGQLILDGTPPYMEAGNLKLPGMYYAYAAIMALLGQSNTGIHIGLIAINLLSTIMLYLLARQLMDAAGAAMAGAAFIIASANNSVLGLFAHATQFVVMFALAGIWLLLEGSRRKRKIPLLFASGLCLGVAIVMKQSGIFFALFGFLTFLHGALRSTLVSWKRILIESSILSSGIVLPYAVVLALVSFHGVFGLFWFWTIDYAATYASEVDPKTGAGLFISAFIPIVSDNPVIWLLSFVGMVTVWLTESGRKAPVLLAFFLFSILSVCPGLHFRQHYFVQLLPAVALYAGAALQVLGDAESNYRTMSKAALQCGVLVALVAVSLTSVLSLGRALVASTPDEFSRLVYGVNPFPESAKVAKYIRESTGSSDRIAVLGSEPQIYFYAHRRPATEHIYMYGLMERQPFAQLMQNELIAQVERNEPPFLVLATVSDSWLQRPESEKRIFWWMRRYIGDHYKAVMVADIHSDQTLWLMGKDAESAAPAVGPSQLIVFKRKSGK